MSPATITIKRPITYSASTVPTVLSVDGDEVARLWIGQSVAVSVAAGRHLLQAKAFGTPESSAARLEIDLSEGETLHLLYRIKQKGLFGFQQTLIPERTSPLVAAADGGSPPRLTLRETGRSEEAIGEESRVIENPSRTTSLTRTVRVNRTWSRSWQIDTESSGTMSGSGKLAFTLAEVEASIEATLRRKYSLTETSSEEFAEEITLQMPPSSRVRLVLKWKRLWQHGEVRVDGPQGAYVVPYKVAAGLTFDQYTD